jgi:hypothetical protein
MDRTSTPRAQVAAPEKRPDEDAPSASSAQEAVPERHANEPSTALIALVLVLAGLLTAAWVLALVTLARWLIAGIA